LRQDWTSAETAASVIERNPLRPFRDGTHSEIRAADSTFRIAEHYALLSGLLAVQFRTAKNIRTTRGADPDIEFFA
jgi:hypothetical protein